MLESEWGTMSLSSNFYCFSIRTKIIYSTINYKADRQNRQFAPLFSPCVTQKKSPAAKQQEIYATRLCGGLFHRFQFYRKMAHNREFLGNAIAVGNLLPPVVHVFQSHGNNVHVVVGIRAARDSQTQ